MVVKNQGEIQILREGGRRLAEILNELVKKAVPGISTFKLDRLAEGLIFESGGRPAFKGYKGGSEIPYPASICASVNDEVVHSPPSGDAVLKDGDILSLDIAMWWPAKIQNSKFVFSTSSRASPVESQDIGFRLKTQNFSLVTDMAVTIGIGQISAEAERLLRVTREALVLGARIMKAGVTVGDIGYVIGGHLEKNGLGIIRNLAGHGLGRELHEDPLIPNYGKAGSGSKLQAGEVVAIEPMATLGGEVLKLDKDGWTFRTVDGSLSAHFEHTILVTENGAEILTVI